MQPAPMVPHFHRTGQQSRSGSVILPTFSEYTFDPGRILTAEEKERAARQCTHITEIRDSCKKEGENSKYRPGRSRG